MGKLGVIPVFLSEKKVKERKKGPLITNISEHTDTTTKCYNELNIMGYFTHKNASSN